MAVNSVIKDYWDRADLFFLDDRVNAIRTWLDRTDERKARCPFFLKCDLCHKQFPFMVKSVRSLIDGKVTNSCPCYFLKAMKEESSLYPYEMMREVPFQQSEIISFVIDVLVEGVKRQMRGTRELGKRKRYIGIGVDFVKVVGDSILVVDDLRDILIPISQIRHGSTIDWSSCVGKSIKLEVTRPFAMREGFI